MAPACEDLNGHLQVAIRQLQVIKQEQAYRRSGVMPVGARIVWTSYRRLKVGNCAVERQSLRQESLKWSGQRRAQAQGVGESEQCPNKIIILRNISTHGCCKLKTISCAFRDWVLVSLHECPIILAVRLLSFTFHILGGCSYKSNKGIRAESVHIKLLVLRAEAQAVVRWRSEGRCTAMLGAYSAGTVVN